MDNEKVINLANNVDNKKLVSGFWSKVTIIIIINDNKWLQQQVQQEEE